MKLYFLINISYNFSYIFVINYLLNEYNFIINFIKSINSKKFLYIQFYNKISIYKTELLVIKAQILISNFLLQYKSGFSIYFCNSHCYHYGFV